MALVESVNVLDVVLFVILTPRPGKYASGLARFCSWCFHSSIAIHAAMEFETHTPILRFSYFLFIWFSFFFIFSFLIIYSLVVFMCESRFDFFHSIDSREWYVSTDRKVENKEQLLLGKRSFFINFPKRFQIIYLFLLKNIKLNY